MKPLNVQVVALQWKWLFIYPEQHIATVNFLEVPTNTPINFSITADAPMNALWIPQLGGQIYAMPGMTTQLHLMASEAGDYRGLSANLSGQGFSGMTFTARAVDTANFTAWVTDAQKSPQRLNNTTYASLAAPSKNNKVAYYTTADTALYPTIVMKYMMSMPASIATRTTNGQHATAVAPPTTAMPDMPGMDMQ
jgi:cytochrome o ubiquinol oxidase subunit 2